MTGPKTKKWIRENFTSRIDRCTPTAPFTLDLVDSVQKRGAKWARGAEPWHHRAIGRRG